MATALTNDQIQQKLKQTAGWKAEADKLTKDFKFSDFKSALAFIVRVGFEAEDAGHHPELFNVYNTVSIALATHDVGGKITEKDFDLAQRIDSIQS